MADLAPDWKENPDGSIEIVSTEMAELLVRETSGPGGLKISPEAEAIIEAHLNTPVAQGIERLTTNQGAGGSSPSGCTNTEGAILREALGSAYPKPSFDRTTYQRDYMRDLPKARAEGLTVKVWRQKHGKE